MVARPSQLFIMASIVWILCLVWFSSTAQADTITSTLALSNYDYYSYTTCSAQGLGYFDASEYRCRSCPSNMVSSTSLLDGLGNAEQCQCEQGYIESSSACSTSSGSCQAMSCTSCLTSGQVTYSDRSACVSCGTGTTGSADSDGDCVCSTTTDALVETDAVGNKLSSKTCSTCPTGQLPVPTSQTIAGAYYSGSKYLCRSCPDPQMSMSLTNNIYACTCGSGYTISGVSGIGPQFCIPTTLTTSFVSQQNAAKTVTYSTAGVTVSDAQVFAHYFLAAASYCTYFGGPEHLRYCQILANLCVLQMYDTSSTVCSIFSDIQANQRSTTLGNPYNVTSWSYGMPWLTYTSSFGAKLACQQTVYSRSVSLNQDHLQFVVAVYALNGSLLSYAPLDTILQYCGRTAPYSQDGGGTGSDTRFQFFATSSAVEYKCSLRSLVPDSTAKALAAQRFYELFLFDEDTGTYTPVPVVTTLSKSDKPDMSTVPATSNTLCDDAADVLNRRFYLVDIVSGISTVDSDPRVIRYAQGISLTVQLIPEASSSSRKGTSTDQIYPPVLRLQYAESAVSSWSAGTWQTTGQGIVASSTSSHSSAGSSTEDVTTYAIQSFYLADLSGFFSTLQGCMIGLVMVFIGVFVMRYHNWNVRHARVITSAGLTTDLGGANIKLCGEILLLLISSYVWVIFPITILVAWYFFVFFKLQAVPSVLLPAQDLLSTSTSSLSSASTDNMYLLWVVNLYLCAFFQGLYVCVTVVHRQCQQEVFFVDWEPVPSAGNGGNNNNAITNGPNAAGGNPSVPTATSSSRLITSPQQQVSIWRTLLIANEFSELQTTRRTSLVFVLFWMGFFMVGLNLQYNATNQPNLEDTTAGPKNIILRFAVAMFFFLIWWMAQILVKYLWWERYYGEPPEQVFMDLCALAKISVFVLDEKFHGYYLHGRSPYQHADVSMWELVELLQQESTGLTSDRGLDGAPKDVQSFQVFLSSEVRDSLDRINAQLTPPQSWASMIDARRNRSAMSNNPGGNNNSGGMFGGRSGLGGMRTGGSSNSLKWGLSSFRAIPSPQVMAAWQEMSSFLQSFVENGLGTNGLRRVVHEPSYAERLCRWAPDLAMKEQPSVFYTDRNWNFTKVVFLGNEGELLLFNLLTYSLCDLWFDDVLTSLLLTYLVDYGLKMWRQTAGNLNLSRKTLVDGRFLV